MVARYPGLRVVLAAAILATLLLQSLAPVAGMVAARAAEAEPVPPIAINETPPLQPPLQPPASPGEEPQPPQVVKKPAERPKPINVVFRPPQQTSGGASKDLSPVTVPAEVEVFRPGAPVTEAPGLFEKEGSFTVYLVTGDRVTVAVDDEGRVAVDVEPSSPGRVFRVMRVGSDLYVLPLGLDLRKFSIDLFNVKLLKEYAELGFKDLPLIVMLARTVDMDEPSSLGAALPRVAGLPHKPLKMINAVAVRVPFDKLPEVYRELASSPDVVAVTLDRIVRTEVVSEPAGEAAPTLYKSVPMIGAPLLWRLGVNGSGVRIAILDTGIDPEHPDFYLGNTSKIVAAVSFVDSNGDGVPEEDPTDGNGHGTHVAGIAAGTGGYLPEIRGIAPGAEILAVKVLSNEGWGLTSWIQAGIEWAVENGADIISMSLGGPAFPGHDPLVATVNEAFRNGTLVVVAAGNEGPGYFTVASPGVAPGALTVGAIDEEGQLAWFSSWGPTPNLTLKPDVVAPGVDIAASRANNTYMGRPASMYHVYASGTSMATPHVSGYAALALQLLKETGVLGFALEHGLAPSALLKDVIVATATGYKDSDPYAFGAGVINATNLLSLVTNERLVIVDPARADVILGNETRNVTLVLLNPWNHSITLRVEPSLYISSYAVTAEVAPDAITVNATVEVPARGSTTLKIAINGQLLPLGFHALRVELVDEATNTTVGQALIGIAKPATLLVNVTYAGAPVEACARAIGLHVSGKPVEYALRDCGNNTLTLGPLYPDTFYIINIWSFIDGPIDYYTIVAVPSNQSETVVTLNIDLATLNYTEVYVPAYRQAQMALIYSHVLQLLYNGSTIASLSIPSYWSFYGVSNYTTRYYTYTSPDIVSIDGYKAYIAPSYFAVEAFTQATGADTRTLNGTLPVDVFYRVYNDTPVGETIVVDPITPSLEMLHIHSAISPEPLTDYSSFGLCCGPVDMTFMSHVAAYTGSQTLYRIDANTAPEECSGIASDYVDAGYIGLYAVDFYGYDLAGTLAYVPLRMPHGATIWSYFYAYQGLDGYNFTGSFTGGHMFRSTVLGYYDMWSRLSDSPLTVMRVAPNCDLENHTMTSYSWGTFVYPSEYWYGHGTIEPPRLCVSMYINNELLNASSIAFFNKIAYMNMYIVSNRTHTDGIMLPAFWYGVGVREIVPVTGYDPLRNMLYPNTTAEMVLIFNQPAIQLDTDSVQVELVDGNGTAVPLSILAWSTYGYLPMAYVAVNTSVLEPGAYAMRISGSYIDNATASRIDFEIYLDPAVYVAIPVGKLTSPVTVRVGPPGSGADYASIAEAVAAATPGSVIEVLPSVYEEEMIVIDKPLTIVGLTDSNGSRPVIVPPNGYPVFIVLASAEIASIDVRLPDSAVATVPSGFTAVPGDALMPPAAIIAYNAGLKLVNVAVERYPRGVTVYGGSIAGYNITVMLDPTYMVNSRCAFAAEPAPIHVYAASSVELQGVYSEELPVIRKTSWQNIELADVYVNDTPAEIYKNETLALDGLSVPAAILLGEMVELSNASSNNVEIVAGTANVKNSYMSRLLASTSSIELAGVSSWLLRLESPNATLAGVRTSSLVALDVITLDIVSSSIEGSSYIVTQPAATVRILDSNFSRGTPAAVYAVLEDGASFNFTGNRVYHSYYGVYIVPLYTESAPVIAIENNTFTDVVVPVYIAAAPATETWLPYEEYYYYSEPQQPAATAETPQPAPEPSLEPGVFNQSFIDASITKVYIGYNTIQNASTGVAVSTIAAVSMVENNIEANRTGVDVGAVFTLAMFFNRIAAPVAANLTATYGHVNYNNLYGDLILTNNSYVDVRFNYLEGNLSVDPSSHARGAEYSYPAPLAVPPTLKVIVPVPSYIDELVTGAGTSIWIDFVNPTPRPVEFQYTVTASGALEVDGETLSTNPIGLASIGLSGDTARAGLELRAIAPGTAALNVKISTDIDYTVTIPVHIKGAEVNMTVTAPRQVQRGEVFNVTIILESNTSGSHILYIGQSGDGAIGFCLDPACQQTTSSRLVEVTLAAGNKTVELPALALKSGSVELTATLYIGLIHIESSTELEVGPNPGLAPDAAVDSYPESLEQGTYSSIILVIDNVTIPATIMVEALSTTGSVDVLRDRYTITIYSAPWYTSIPIYGDVVGNDTITIRVHDLDDNVTILNTSVEITVTPGYVYGYKAVYGYVSPAISTSNGSIAFPNTTAWADLWAYVSISQAITSLESLKNMLSVPWGCVEQTTSPLLAGIQVYRYLDSQKLWSDAATAMGYNSTDAFKSYIVNDIVAAGVERLLEAHGAQCTDPSVDVCSYSWYPGLRIDLFYTPYGLLGLLRAYEFQKDYSLTLYSNMTRWNMTIEKLVHGLINAQNSDGSWGDSDQIYFTSFALYSLVEAYRLGFKPYNASVELLESSILNATKYLETAVKAAIAAQTDVGDVIAALYALTAVNATGLPVDITVITDAIDYLERNVEGSVDGMVWWSGLWPHYWLSYYTYLTTAKAATALYQASQLLSLDAETRLLAESLSVNATRFLTVNLDWLRSRNTFEAAAVLEAINTLGMEIQFLYGETGYTISYIIRAGSPNGEILLNASISATDDFWYCYISDITNVDPGGNVWCKSYEYIRPGNWLELSDTLYIEESLKGNATANWFTNTFYRYIPLPGASASQAARKEVYLATSQGMIPIVKQTTSNNVTSASEFIDITKTVTPPVALPGSTITVRLEVKSKSGALNYVIVSDPIPPGFELINESINITPASVAAVDWEYYNERNGTAIGFAIASLDETGVVIEYQLRVPETAAIGDIVTLAPANATLFYTPSDQELEPAESGQPTVSIGLSMSTAIETVFYARSSVANGTQIRWGEILNITVGVSLPSTMLTTLNARLVILDENMTQIGSQDIDLTQGWILLVTSAMTDVGTLERLQNKTIYIVLAVYDDQDNTLTRQLFKLRLPVATENDFADMLDSLRLFWLSYKNEPWFNEVFGKLLDGLRYTWLLTK